MGKSRQVIDNLEMAGRAKLADNAENMEIAKITATAKTRGRVKIMEMCGRDGNCENYGYYGNLVKLGKLRTLWTLWKYGGSGNFGECTEMFMELGALPPLAPWHLGTLAP